MEKEHHFTEQELQRRESLKQIIEAGINPYPSETYNITSNSKMIHELKDDEILKNIEVSIAGRIISKRIMGKASFCVIQDEKGKIQLYISRDEICQTEDKLYYNELFKKWMDIGDIIGIKGHIFKTQTGEITVKVKELKLLTKSLYPLPIVKEKEGHLFDAFTDPEQRYRHRYIDLIVNPQIKEVFIKRTKIYQSIRNFLNEKGYLEVETPILQPIYGGALAKPFKTHHNTLNQDLYLRIANELYLKRLIVGGFEGVYEFAKDFRNEGMSRFHNPEFSQIEVYVAYKDYLWMMELVESMIERAVIDLSGKTEVEYDGKIINFKKPWKRISMYDAIKEYTGTDVSEMDEQKLRVFAKEKKVHLDSSFGKGKIIDELFGEFCEPHFIQPTFITDYPVEMSPLAKKHRNKKGLVERFEGICNGKEICNAFSELNDPIDQRQRFMEQIELGKRGDIEAMKLDEDFLRSIEIGLPPTAGLGMGMDRLTMVLTNSKSIQDVLFFPQMRNI